MDQMGYYLFEKGEWRFGVKRLREFDISLLEKWVWRVLEERESLWNVVLRVKYGEVGGRVWFCEGV